MKRIVLLLLCTSLAWPAEVEPLRGFSVESSRVERDWETKFRAIPDPANLRAYMLRLAARPHQSRA